MTVPILALDLGDKTGWAARFGDGATASGVLDLCLLEHEHPGMRWPRVRDELRRLVERVAPKWLAWEQIIPASAPGSRARSNLYGLEAQVVEIAAEYSVEPKTVHLATLKKFACGNGKAKKDEMRAAASARWPGLAFASHDEVDARWVLEWTIHELAARVVG